MCYGLPFGELRLKDEIARQLMEEAAEARDADREHSEGAPDRTVPRREADTDPSFLREAGETDVTLLTGDAAEE
jgi:hypothetical protein